MTIQPITQLSPKNGTSPAGQGGARSRERRTLSDESAELSVSRRA